MAEERKIGNAAKAVGGAQQRLMAEICSSSFPGIFKTAGTQDEGKLFLPDRLQCQVDPGSSEVLVPLRSTVQHHTPSRGIDPAAKPGTVELNVAWGFGGALHNKNPGGGGGRGTPTWEGLKGNPFPDRTCRFLEFGVQSSLNMVDPRAQSDGEGLDVAACREAFEIAARLPNNPKRPPPVISVDFNASNEGKNEFDDSGVVKRFDIAPSQSVELTKMTCLAEIKLDEGSNLSLESMPLFIEKDGYLTEVPPGSLPSLLNAQACLYSTMLPGSKNPAGEGCALDPVCDSFGLVPSLCGNVLGLERKLDKCSEERMMTTFKELFQKDSKHYKENELHAFARRGKKTSKFTGVSHHVRCERWEAHIWVNRWGKQVYLGGFDAPETAATAYDLVAIKLRGPTDSHTNFTTNRYKPLFDWIESLSLETLLSHIRRQSKGFSRGKCKYRGVTRHSNGHWEARIGIPGNRHIYLGIHRDPESAARKYDQGIIRMRGPSAASNFPLSDYTEELKQYRKLKEATSNQRVARWVFKYRRKLYYKWVKSGLDHIVDKLCSPPPPHLEIDSS